MAEEVHSQQSSAKSSRLLAVFSSQPSGGSKQSEAGSGIDRKQACVSLNSVKCELPAADCGLPTED